MERHPMELHEVKPEPVDIPFDQPIKSFRKKLISILYKIQRYSTYGFLSFFSLHTTSVTLIPSFLPMHINQEIFQLARLIYLNVPFETLIYGSGILHIASGILLRILRPRHKVVTLDAKKKIKSDEVGLGGITNLIGIGPKIAIISRLTNNALTPLTFSGYCLIPSLLYHLVKFKLVPLQIEGDSSLISLQYVNVVLNHSMIKYGNILNIMGLVLLVYTANYHFISGLFKLQNKYLDYWKKIGFMLINGLSLIGFISILKFKNGIFDDGYLFTKFLNYVKYSRI